MSKNMTKASPKTPTVSNDGKGQRKGFTPKETRTKGPTPKKKG